MVDFTFLNPRLANGNPSAEFVKINYHGSVVFSLDSRGKEMVM